LDADPKTVVYTQRVLVKLGNASRFQIILEEQKIVKFQVCRMKKRYKTKKEYRYKHYSLGFPAKLNEKIEPQT
jgi:hypothetical protein